MGTQKKKTHPKGIISALSAHVARLHIRHHVLQGGAVATFHVANGS